MSRWRDRRGLPTAAAPGQAAARRARPRSLALPTPESRRAAFDSRGWEIPHKTSDPELTQHNLLERDRMFTDRLVEETKHLELPVIEIDTAMNESELVGQVTQAFGL